MTQRLKLRAGDNEDVSIVSACMQDALVACNDLSFLPGERRFVLVAQRFKWENCPEFLRPDLVGIEPCENYERVNSILVFDEVTGVRLFDLRPVPEAKLLELLAIAVEAGQEDEGPSVMLFFAGGGAIRLEVRRILCHLEDLGESWPTQRRPSHPMDEGA
jgi:hypothetical protein